MNGQGEAPEPGQKSGKFRANLPGGGRVESRSARRAVGLFCGAGLLVMMLVCGGCASPPLNFHPNPAVPPSSFSHATWDRLVRSYVVDGEVNYPGLAKDKGFREYLHSLNHVDPQALPTREARLAFWINVYNALAAKGIVDGYSPRSLWGRYRFFVGRDYTVGGAELNLYDLERKILLPAFNEPRIHFAIVCASRSCPKLQSWAYDPDDLDRQLDRAARAFINDPSRNRFDRERRVAHLSMVFNWFMHDFMGHSGSVIQYIKPYLDDPSLVKELNVTPYRVEFLKYDWSVNGIPPPEE